MDRATSEQISVLRGHLDYLRGIDVTPATGLQEWGTVYFSQREELFKAAKLLAEGWSRFQFEQIPRPRIEEITELFAALKNAIERKYEFLNSILHDPGQERDQLLDAVRQALDHAESRLFELRPCFGVITADHWLRDAQEQHAEDQRKSEARREELEDAIRLVREDAKSKAVQRFAPLFEELARENARDSNWWLWATIGLGATAAGIALFLLPRLPVDGSIGEGRTLSHLLGRIVVISLLYYGAIWASRNYRALRHQRTVNQHRHKALLTFQTFVEGGESPETRDAVLREATRCVFSPAASGFLSKEPDGPQGGIVEVLQTATRRSPE